MLTYLITYLIIGGAWMMFLRLSEHLVEKHNLKSPQFTPEQILFLGLIWPFSIVVFMGGFIMSFLNNK